MKTTERSGFTLIELSLVLIIAGLILGGILVGRDMIHAAEVRKTVSEADKIKTAVNTFMIKYNCLPGDCANISNIFSGATDGDGNGFIEEENAAGIPEASMAFYQLGLAGLVAGSYAQISSHAAFVATTNAGGNPNPAVAPQGAIKSSWITVVSGISTNNFGGVFPLGPDSYVGNDGNEYTFCDNCIVISGFGLPVGAGDYAFSLISSTKAIGITPEDAFSIDSKIDDGLPLSGGVRPMLPAATSSPQLGMTYGDNPPHNADCSKPDLSNSYYFNEPASNWPSCALVMAVY